MTQIESILICTMIKNKYSGKTVGEVFPDIILPNTKFDDLKCVLGGLGLPNGYMTFMHPNSFSGLVYRKRYNGMDTEFTNYMVFLKDHIDVQDKI